MLGTILNVMCLLQQRNQSANTVSTYFKIPFLYTLPTVLFDNILHLQWQMLDMYDSWLFSRGINRSLSTYLIPDMHI